MMRSIHPAAPLLFVACLACARLSAAAEIVVGPLVQMPAPGEVIIAWETDVPTQGRVIYGQEGTFDRSASSPAAGTRHEVTLGELAPGNAVSYRVFAGTTHTGVYSFFAPPGPDHEVKVVVLGDTRTMHRNHLAVVESALVHEAHVTFNTGDLVERGDDLDMWKCFFAVERPLLASTVSFSAIGNHEQVGDGVDIYKSLFVYPPGSHAPELDFTVDVGPARFVVLDNAVTAKNPETQREWLERVLDEADALPAIAHVIVFVHQGVQSNGPHGPSKSLIAAGLDDVMRDHGVDLVIAGHDHSYERGVTGGLRYMISAGGGAPLYKKKVDRGDVQVRAIVHHHVLFSIGPGGVTFRVVLKDGSVLETCSLAPLPGGYTCQ